MSADTCVSCGSSDCIDDLVSPYCGSCGATWGRQVKPTISGTARLGPFSSKPTVAPPAWSRAVSAAPNLNAFLANPRTFGIKGRNTQGRVVQPYADVATTEREWTK